MTRVKFGSVETLSELPAQVSVGSETYFLVHDGQGFRLLSTVCPHQGGAVAQKGSHFECPLHGWQFDRETGRCLNAPSRALSAIPVFVDDGVLYADLPAKVTLDPVSYGAREAKPGLTIQLHSHACLEISYEGFTLLTDPWLDGPAFFGSWVPYPPPDCSAADLRPDAILITHEHSDHFHEPSMRHFDRRTPIYVPDFPNRRLPERLAALGFMTVIPMRFGDRYEAHPGWSLTAFEAASNWNDAFLLVDVDGFRIFDINDAGVNARIASIVGRVDLLAVQFSAGASGYPWTWGHLSDEQKVAISIQRCAGKLKLIREAAALYGATTVLPFASHFTLWHPSHRAFVRLMKRNTLDDVKTALKDDETEVIDLLPGETWGVGKRLIQRAATRAELFAPERLDAYMRSAVNSLTFDACHPTDESLSSAELIAYLERLNSVPEIVHCEEVTVRFRGMSSTAGSRTLDVSCAVSSGRLLVLPVPLDAPKLTIDVPLGILTAIVRDGISWDEAFIGYWCRFSRDSHVYHAGFWRLLHAPYFRRHTSHGSRRSPAIGPGSIIAELLESYGDEADRILRRYGLYCSGCHRSIAESLEQAGRQHGVDPRRIDMLVRELTSAIA